jgi:shikimate dehydrogenase
LTQVAAVLGWPVAHSRSPALHNAAYRALGIDAVYVPFAVAPGALAAALGGVRALGLLGVNVTVPHKEEARRLCDEFDALAAAVGAVNTIVVRAGPPPCAAP